MNVKGIIYNTGKTTIIAVFGKDRWDAFVPKLAAKDKFFSNIIMSVTPVPLDKFILFLDELVKEFFNNDMMQYVTFGKVAAQFALSPEGQYKSYMITKDTKRFVESVMPKLWAA
jgi:RAB protein geranylgeranyltransferase component A